MASSSSSSGFISPGDELVDSVTLLRTRPWFLHGYAAPFFVLYPAWAYVWMIHFGVEDNFEPGIIALVGIALIQILAGLSCYWSVHVLALFTCSKVKKPSDATSVKVVPTANNGFAEIVRVRRDADETWFMFQKLKYFWEDDKKVFRGVSFPSDHSFQHYLDWKGYESEESLATVEKHFGKNR